MASEESSQNVLEWVQNDKHRFLHAVYRVGNLERTIKFYTECFGMKLLRQRDIPEEKYSNAFLGFGPEESHFVVELTYNYGVDKYDIGTGFGHFAIATEDVYKLVEDIRAKGGKITREPGPVKGGATVIAFVQDPDGYIFELIQRGPTPEPLCQVMLRVGDLDRSIAFYEKVRKCFLLKQHIDNSMCIKKDFGEKLLYYRRWGCLSLDCRRISNAFYFATLPNMTFLRSFWNLLHWVICVFD